MKPLLTALALVIASLTLPLENAEASETMSLTVRVTHGSTEAPLADTAVFLRAARPKGPFEPTDPEPAYEAPSLTDANGLATFDSVPADLATRGLRVHALTTFGGMTFKTSPSTPSANMELDLKVYEKGVVADDLRFSNLRTIVEVWEGYLVFTQYYGLTNTGNTAIDTLILEGADPEKGLRIELSHLAKGIQVNGPGESTVVNSTVFWKGTLAPGETAPLQMRFSMTEQGSEFVYEQEMGFPVDNIELVLPIQTQYQKLPRLDKVSLAAPGFEMLSGNGILGLRNDREFIGATGKKVDAGESFQFKVSGLPFESSMAPWAVLGAGLFFAALVVVVGRREVDKLKSRQTREELLKGLEKERDALLDALVELERDLEADEVTEREYELESLALKERLALIMNKIREFDDTHASA